MFCKQCGNELKQDELFCSKCGIKVTNDNFNNVQNEQVIVDNLNNQQNHQFVSGQVVLNDNKTNKINSKLGLLIGIAAAFLIVVGFVCYYLISINNPTNIYRGLIKKGINEVYDVVNQNDDKLNTTFNLGLNLDLEQELLDQTLIDLINKTTIGFNYQMDKDSEQLVLKLDSDYGKDSLIYLQLFIDNKNEKIYLYAKDYYDKYLEVEMEDYSSFTELFEDEEPTFVQIINSKKAKEIVIEEFTKIIKSEDCSKEDGAYVLEITAQELVSRIKTAITNLKNNEKFLDCYEEPDSIKDAFSEVIDLIDESSPSAETFKVSIRKKMLSNKFEKLVVSSMGSEAIFENKDEETTYKFNSDGELVLSGYIKTKEEKNTNKSEILLQIPEFGKLKLNLDIIIENDKEIDKVNTSKVKSFDEVTEEEQTEIMTKVQNSKLFEIITLISESLGMSDDNYYDDDYDYDYDYDFDFEDSDDNNFTTGSSDTLNVYDYKTINLNIPDGFVSTYDSDTYKVYEKDDIEITIKASSYDSVDEYFKDLDRTVEYAKKDEYYKNIVLSEKNNKVVDGTTYYYKDYSYEYMGVISNTKYYEKHFCSDLGNDYYLIIEISSQNNPISDGLLDVILSID